MKATRRLMLALVLGAMVPACVVTGTAHIVDAGALNPFKAPHFRDAAGNLIGPREPRAVSSATASQR